MMKRISKTRELGYTGWRNKGRGVNKESLTQGG